ncbi:integrase arm-type DNA-binding domain-containing protein [Rhodobacterales bacterium HKCCE3408]|nr:integrase arm-type DNA-binding domain-containing protein [Rhodobacterales bacterium HKCCE3408]
MGKALTTVGVEAAKPDPSKRIERPDPALSGLYLIIQPSGAKSWALRYRWRGKPKKLTLGRWPVMGVAEARKAATEALGTLTEGTDPGAVKKAAELADRDNVASLIETFSARHLSKLKSGDHARQFLDRFVVAAWGDRKVGEIKRRDVIELLDEIADSGRGTTANRVLAHTRKFFNWCVERDVIEIAPTTGVKPPHREQSRARVLSDEEIKRFWKACDAVGYPWGHLGKLLLLTGQRLGELQGMTRDEIEGDLWRLEGDRTKNGRAHDVPLSEAAQAVLDDCPKLGTYVLSMSGAAPLKGNHRGRGYIAAAMGEAEHWTFHDLRRTAATGMARIGVPVRITEACLNHVSGTGGGIVAVYQRHDYLVEKRQALEAWGRLVLDLIEGQGKVMQLQG